MTLSDLSIKNPVFAWMLMAGLIVFGGISFQRMGVSQMPDVDFPVVSVALTWEGAAPEVMETDMVDVVEEAVMTVQGIRDVSSSTRQGQATVTIEFELNRDIDAALQEIQTKIAQAQRLLPRDMDPPVVTKVNPEDNPIMWIGVSGEVSARELTEYVQDHLKDQFQTVDGVGEIFLGGFVERNLRVWLDAEKLEAYQLTVQDVINAIGQEHAEMPAGRIETPRHEFNVRTMGEANTVEEFGDIIIARRGGSPVYRPISLKDVATIEDGLADVRRISRIMGKTAIGLGVRKQRGANAVAVARRVHQRLAQLQRQLPTGIRAEVVNDTTRFIEDSVKELTFTLLLSAILTSLVCWFFLGSWSATLNVLLAIPTSVIGSFMALGFLGFTLNTFTLLGLSLAIGIVVDDAIMVLENIVRYREQGLGQVEAAQLGARQITFAAIAATLAILAIFLPVAFMQGIIGKFFFQFGVTMSVAVSLSLLEALTLAPMRCAQFLQVGERRTAIGKAVEGGFWQLAQGYRRALAWSLRRRGLVLIMASGVFIASLTLLPRLRKEFVPPQDQSMFLVRLQTPVGSSIEFTNERFKQAEQFVMSRPEIRRYFGAIGGFGGGEVNTGMLFVTLKPPRQRRSVPPQRHPLSQAELMVLFRKELNSIPGVQRAVIQDLSLSGFSAQRGFPIEVTVRGPDWDQLTATAEAMRQEMAKSPLMVDVDTNYLSGIPEVQVRPDRQRAAGRGVSIETIGATINALIGGERVGKYTRGGRRYDVRVRLIPSDIGVILLMGIVKKNSILLVEFTNQLREQGRSVLEALLEACPIRLRPILMTSVSTIAAAIPPALALGPGAETRIPMAVTVIGGMTLSTLLTLFVVPCAYSLLTGFTPSHGSPLDIKDVKGEEVA